MLSTENQPDLPCCSRASDADPNFSIRDYAFASRSKDRETSWPFPHKLLQLCFKHGIKDPLPPFEPPDSVRSQCQRKTDDLEAGLLIIAPVIGLHEITEPEFLLTTDEIVSEARYPSRKEEKKQILDGYAETLSAVTSNDRITEVKFARRPSLPEKNCKLLLNLSLISQTRRTEDVPSASSTISDPMASKVCCPVCKIFSSPSNTTLNAHMDRCLSAESNNTELVATQSKNPKVKPRLKRLMVDIYANARHCTHQDLDSRNGTTWARDLALIAVPSGGELPTETKRPRLSSVDFRHDGDEAVYVDSNGIKLRILSKSSGVPPVMPKDESKLTKHVTEVNEGKGSPFSKNKKFGSKLLKHMKVKQMSKKLSTLDMPRSETEAQLAEDYHAETNKEKEETMLPVVARSNIESSGHATLGQWVCSKRSCLRKKMEKAIRECSENQELTTKRPLLQSNRPDLSGPPVVPGLTNSSWSAEDYRSYPKTKRVGFLQTMSNKKGSPIPHVEAKLSTGSTLSNCISLKSSRPCQSSRSMREEHLSSPQKSDNAHHTTARTLDSCHLSMKAKKIFSLKKNILVRSSLPSEEEKDNAGEIAPKMFRKRRSKLVTIKHGGELSTDANGTSKRVRTPRSNFSLSTLSSITEKSRDQMSPRRGGPHESENEREEVMPIVELNHIAEQEPLEAEGHDTMDKVNDDRISFDTLICEHIMTDSATSMDTEPSGGKYVQSVSGSESHEEPTAPTLYDKIGDYSQVVQHGESDAETVSAQESSACLTSHGEVGLDALASDREPSFSPGSTASTLSTLSRKVRHSRDLEAEEEEVRTKYEREVELRNEEVEMISLAKEPEQLSDDQPCCCARREGLSTEFPKMSSLYVAPRQSSFVSYSSSRTPTESTKLSADSSVKFPGNGGLCSNSTFSPSQAPSTSNSVLRLMGKDLMVIKEESSQPSNAQTPPPVSPFPSLEFAPTRAVSNQESFWYSRSQLQTGSYAFCQAPAAAGPQFPLHAGLMTKSEHQPHQEYRRPAPLLPVYIDTCTTHKPINPNIIFVKR